MNSKYAALVFSFAFAASSLPAAAQDFGDSRKGLAFAKMVCAECHAVEKTGAPSPNRNAPPFGTVAATSGMTAMALRTWLQTSHPTMPNIVLNSNERADVIAYILSLKGK
jgi:mono/diheme cytochrome c family protein